MVGRIVCALCLVVGCESTEDAGGGFETTTTPRPSGSGFSSDLAKQLGSDSKDSKDSKGSDSKVAVADSKGSDAKPEAKGSDAKPDPKDTKPDPKDTKPDPKDTKPDPKDTKPDGKGSDSKPDPRAGKGSATSSPDQKLAVGSGDTKAGSGEKGPPAIDTAKPRTAVKVSAEMAAIRLSLSPNWDRDVGEGGTISLVVKIPGTDNTKVFAFRYGYEDPKAPTDREAYKKWLKEQGILAVTLDRQRGGSWYLEGTDGSGMAVFRSIVVFGGKKLICGGSLYKDAASNQLGDIRDKTIIQAKEICETVAL